MPRSDEVPPYVVPRYRAPDDAAWYHALHGTVPGHQIDFLVCPEVPQGSLTRTHIAHLARLMKYIEPHEHAPFAFALANLSRDDVQHEPGHGGLALVFGLRVEGVVDHAGRAMPPYAHAVLAVDRALDYRALLEAVTTFHRRVLHAGSASKGESFYRKYVQARAKGPGAALALLHEYLRGFSDLPQLAPSTLSSDWTVGEEVLHKRITIVHRGDEPFGTLAHTAARLGALLYRSNIKWTTIASGRESDIPGGVSIRFAPAGGAPAEAAGFVVSIEDFPEQDSDVARILFGARRYAPSAPPPRARWRERQESDQTERHPSADGEGPEPRLSPANAPPSERSVPLSSPVLAPAISGDPPEAYAPPEEQASVCADDQASGAAASTTPSASAVAVGSAVLPPGVPVASARADATTVSATSRRRWIPLAGGIVVMTAVLWIAQVVGAPAPESEVFRAPPAQVAPPGVEETERPRVVSRPGVEETERSRFDPSAELTAVETPRAATNPAVEAPAPPGAAHQALSAPPARTGDAATSAARSRDVVPPASRTRHWPPPSRDRSGIEPPPPPQDKLNQPL